MRRRRTIASAIDGGDDLGASNGISTRVYVTDHMSTTIRLWRTAVTVCLRVIFNSILLACTEEVFRYGLDALWGWKEKRGSRTYSTIAVSSLDSSCTAMVLVSGIWVGFVKGMALGFKKVALDVIISPAFCSEAHPFVVIGRCALRDHHCVHGAAAYAIRIVGEHF